MNKLVLLFPLLLLISCSQEKKNSITLGVDQTIKIPVKYVSVSANIQLENVNASTAEEKGYRKLSQAVNLLEDWGYQKDQLEINSGEVSNQSYRDEQSFEYNSSINFDIKKLDQIDSIRRALVNKGVNSFRITSYSNSKEDSLYNHAYRQAIQKAKEKAQGLFTNQQVEIGEILNLSQNVKEIVKVASIKKMNEPQSVNINSELSLEPLFNKKYYDRRIKFTIEFALN